MYIGERVCNNYCTKSGPLAFAAKLRFFAFAKLGGHDILLCELNHIISRSFCARELAENVVSRIKRKRYIVFGSKKRLESPRV